MKTGMKQGAISLAEFPNENYSSVTVPIWTIPEIPSVLSSNDIQPPTYNEFNHLPPDYFDISIVPNNAVVHYSEVIPFVEPSNAKIIRKKNGPFSLDPLVDRNPDQLWLYFMTYLNEKPYLVINIHGYHIEHYTSIENIRINGRVYARAVHRTRSVTDFNYDIDLEPYISQQWWRVAAIPSKKKINNAETTSFRDTLEQYTLSEKNIKEIFCQKQLVGWNFDELKGKIQELIYSTGYQNNIDINFVIDNHRITARSSSRLSRFSNSIWIRVLCFLSCLCLIFAPIYLCLRSRGSTRDQIVADYNMLSSSDTFLHINAGVIVNAAVTRSRQRYLAKIT